MRTKLVNGERIELTSTEEAALVAEESAYVPKPPQVVTAAQAWTALHRAGLLESVESLMADPGTNREAVIAWNKATHFRRTSPFIDELGPGLGLSDEEIDNLFIAAAAVE